MSVSNEAFQIVKDQLDQALRELELVKQGSENLARTYVAELDATCAAHFKALRELGEARSARNQCAEAAVILDDEIDRIEAARDAALRSTAELRGALEAVREWFSGNTVRSEKAMRPLIERIDTALASSSTKET